MASYMRGGKRLLIVAALLATLVATMLGAGAWRLGRGPVDVGWLRPYAIDALRNARPGLAVSIDSVQLAWATPAHQLELRGLGVRLDDSQSQRAVSLPMIALRPRLGALIRGRLELGGVTLVGLHLDLVRTARGLALPAAKTTEQASSSIEVPAVLASVRGLLDMVGHVELRDGEVAVHSEGAGTWRAAAIHGSLAADGSRLLARVAARLGDAATPMAIETTVDERAAGGVHLRVAIDQAVLPTLWHATPGTLRAMLPAAVETVATSVTSPVDATFELDIAPDGTIATPIQANVRSEPLSIAGDSHMQLRNGSLHIAAHIDAAAQAVTIDEGRMAFAETAISWRGAARTVGSDPVLDAAVSIDRLPVGALRGYWPASVAPAARRWVLENIATGVVHDLSLTLHARLANGSNANQYDLKGTYEDVSVRFAPDMPPARNVRGHIAGSAAGVVFAVGQGRIEELEITGGTVTITPGRGQQSTRVSVDADVVGPLARAISVLEHEPVNLERVLPMAAEDVDGTFRAHVACGVPIGGNAPESATVAAAGHLSNTALRRAIDGWTVTDGDIDVRLDAATVGADGRVLVNQVPVAVSLQQRLIAPGRLEMRLQAKLDDAARERLGIALGDAVRGSIALQTDVVRTSQGGWQADIDADLQEVTVASSLAALAKSSGTPGRATARVTIASSEELHIKHCDIDAGRFALNGSAERVGGAWRTMQGQLELRGAPAAKKTVVDITARGGTNATTFSVRSGDAGSLLALLAGLDAQGGRLSFDGALPSPFAATSVRGTLQMDDLRMVRAPVIAKMLALGSLSGLTSLVLREGVRFKTIRSELAYDGAVLHVNDGRAEADAMVILARGTMNLDTRQVDLRGSLIPSYYGLNAAPQKIPILGKLIEKATGEALQVIDARVHGSLDEPTVAIEPTSIFAPEIVKEQLDSGGKKARGRTRR